MLLLPGVIKGAMSEQLRTPATQAPEFFRLPSRGPDPFFGLSRGFYYELERDGLLQMVRIQRPGTKRGVLLVPFEATRRLILGAKIRPPQVAGV